MKKTFISIFIIICIIAPSRFYYKKGFHEGYDEGNKQAIVHCEIQLESIIQDLLHISKTEEDKNDIICQDIIRENAGFGFQKVEINDIRSLYLRKTGSLYCANLSKLTY